MPVNKEGYLKLIKELQLKNVTLIAVSKTKPVEDIQALYDLGQRDFGENYVQELLEKQPLLPGDIRWHFIGHLQTNKVKLIASFVQLIHSVDSLRLLKEINKEGEKNRKVIDCLLQVYIAKEESKFGFDEKELEEIVKQVSDTKMPYLQLLGLMGMASFTNDLNKVRMEFRHLKSLFDKQGNFPTLCMGMSGDYTVAIEEGSNMVRLGTILFGEREKKV